MTKKTKQRETIEDIDGGEGRRGGAEVGAGGTYDPEGWSRSLEGAVNRRPNSKVPKEVISEGHVFPTKGCEVEVSQKLSSFKNFDAGLPMYEEQGHEDFLSDDKFQSAKDFVKILRGIAVSIFQIPSIDTGLAVFVNLEHRRTSSSASIAFNLGGRLYFNFAYYYDYQRSTPLYQVWHYWFITFCHEIAHNLEENHNQRHEHITDALQTKYFSAFCEAIGAKPAKIIPSVQM